MQRVLLVVVVVCAVGEAKKFACKDKKDGIDSHALLDHAAERLKQLVEAKDKSEDSRKVMVEKLKGSIDKLKPIFTPACVTSDQPAYAHWSTMQSFVSMKPQQVKAKLNDAMQFAKWCLIPKAIRETDEFPSQFLQLTVYASTIIKKLEKSTISSEKSCSEYKFADGNAKDEL